jgi:hypothetical protein
MDFLTSKALAFIVTETWQMSSPLMTLQLTIFTTTGLEFIIKSSQAECLW